MMRGSGERGEKEEIRKGPWKAEEDEVLINYVKKYGARDWSSIRSTGLLQRTSKSCRLRWVNNFRPNLKNGCKFSLDEEKKVLELQAQIGNKWARIATHLEGRTDNDVKNFWSNMRKKRLLNPSPSAMKSKKNSTAHAFEVHSSTPSRQDLYIHSTQETRTLQDIPPLAKLPVRRSILATSQPKAPVAPSTPLAKVTPPPPLHDASQRAEETGNQMVIFRGCQVNATVLTYVNRLEHAYPEVFVGLILKTPGLLAMIYEIVSKVIQILDQFSPSTLPAKELGFIESVVFDLEVSGVAVGWLKCALDILKKMQDASLARLEVERLRQVALEATKVYKVAKLRLDDQVQGIFGEGLEVTSSYSAILKI